MRPVPLLRLNEVVDEDGLRPSDWRELDAGLAEHDREQRRRALRALWLTPIVEKVRYDGVICYRDNRDEDWTFWRSVRTTIGLLLGRHSTDKQTCREGAYLHPAYPFNMAYWDSRSVYGGYEVERLQLYPGCRVSLFNDGETNL